MHKPRLDPRSRGGEKHYWSNLCIIGYGMIILLLAVKTGIWLCKGKFLFSGGSHRSI